MHAVLRCVTLNPQYEGLRSLKAPSTVSRLLDGVSRRPLLFSLLITLIWYARRDQFCSLVFTLADLWFAGCAYGQGLRDWRVCTTGRNWGPMFALGALPFFVRFVQSLRRYADSRQWTHLVNVSR